MYQLFMSLLFISQPPLSFEHLISDMLKVAWSDGFRICLPRFWDGYTKLTINSYYSILYSNFDEKIATFGDIWTERAKENTFGKLAKSSVALTDYYLNY